MDIVVYLALAVLAAVFLFSSFMLVVMCHRRYEYNRLLMAHSLRFSKLRQDNLDDVIQLGPHLSQKLSNNQWVEEVSGILQNCVSVLKLCHHLTDKMSKIPLNQISPLLNEVICQATTRVVPRFDILLRSMAAKNVDIRIIEARVSALITACWSLVTPFLLFSPKYKDALGSVVQEMELHHAHLQFALEQVEGDLSTILQTSTPNNSLNGSSALPPPSVDDEFDKNDKEVCLTVEQNHQQTSLDFNSSLATQNIASEKINSLPLIINNRKLSENTSLCNGIVTLKCTKDDAARDLLNDEAPADPSCF